MVEQPKRRPLTGWQEVVVTLLDAYPAEMYQNQLLRKANLDPQVGIRGIQLAEQMGLVKVTKVGNMKAIKLTPRGREVAEYVKKIKEIVQVSEFSERGEV